MLPSVLLVILLALPVLAAVVVALLGSRHAMLALFGHSHELAAVLGSHEAVEALEARARLRQGHIVRWVTLVTTLLALVLAIWLAVDVAKPRILAHGDEVANQSLPEVRRDLLQLNEGSAIQFFIRLDGMNVWLIVLTAVLMVSSVLVSWTAITERIGEFYAWLLVLQGAMLGVFLAFDIVLFYVFFEMTLIPLFFLIGIWGGEERQYAARKFFVFTLAGGLITLVGLIGVVIVVSHAPVRNTVEGQTNTLPSSRITFAIPELVQAVADRSKFMVTNLDVAQKAETEAIVKEGRATDELAKPDNRTKEVHERLQSELDTAHLARVGAEKQRIAAEEQQHNWRLMQYYLFAAMMVGFAVKVPLFPVHTWLPLAHVQAPTAGSVLLAGVLLKIGTYGFLRLCLPLAPEAALTFGAPLLGTLAVVGILYGAFCALAQDDMKKLVAYSSVSHLGFCVLGLFALNDLGLQGALLQMINHGLSTGRLFLIVGMLYERYHTRKLADYGGMAAKLKLLAAFMVFITMSSVGLPGLNGFVGEFFVLSGMFGVGQGPWINGQLLAVLSSFGVVLGAWYMLSLLKGVYFGEVKEPHHGQGAAPDHGHHSSVKDLNGREIAALAPIAALCLLLGVYPQPFLDTAKLEIQAVSRTLDEARARRSPETSTVAAKPETPTQALANQALANPESDPLDAQLVNALTGYLPQVLPEAVLIVMACVLFLGGTSKACRTVWGTVAALSIVVALLTLWGVAAFVPTFETRQEQALPGSEHSPHTLREQVVDRENHLTSPTLSPEDKRKLQNELESAQPLLVEQFASPLLFSRLAVYVKALTLIGGLLLLLASWDDVPGTYAADTFGCLLLIIAGTSLTAGANDLVTLFLSLELISIPTYIILYLPRANAPAQEAAVKYFLLSIFSSALLLFGFSYLYGLTGSTNLAAVTEVLSGVRDGRPERGMIVLALVLVVAGLGFRITAVPFHFYAPDVFQGTTTANAAMLAFIPKVAGFVALFKLLPLLGFQVPTLLWALAAITMTAGNILALLQDNVKRLLAYSSVAHAGYMLIGLAVAPHLTASAGMTGAQAILFYLVAYGAMNIGAFAVLSYLSTPERPIETADDLAGLGRTHPALALVLTLFLFSLIGLPLTAGFLGKFQLFVGALSVPVDQSRYYVYLVLIAAVNAAIGGWYYLRLVAVMFLRESLRPIQKAPTWPVLVSIWACALVTLVGGMLPAPISNAAREAGGDVVRPALPVPPAAPAGQAQGDEPHAG